MATKKKQATQARGAKAPRASSRARAEERAREEAREKKRERDRAYRARKKAEAEEAERKRLEALERRRERDRARREAEREAERKRLEALERRRERDRARRAAEKAERERLEAERKQRRRERDRARREAEREAERKRLAALERRRERDRARRAAEKAERERLEREEKERERKKEEKKKREAERKRKKREAEKEKREVCADLFRDPSTVPEIVWGSSCFYRSTPFLFADGTFSGEIVELAGKTEASARKAWDRIEQFTRAFWAESKGYWMRTGVFGTPSRSRQVDKGPPGDTSARRKERQFGRASLPAAEGHYTGWKRIGKTPKKRTKWTTAAAWRLGGRRMAEAMLKAGWTDLRVVEQVFTGRDMPEGL